MGSIHGLVVVSKTTFIPYLHELGQFVAYTADPVIKYVLRAEDFTGPSTLGALANSSFYFGNGVIPPVATDTTQSMINPFPTLPVAHYR